MYSLNTLNTSILNTVKRKFVISYLTPGYTYWGYYENNVVVYTGTIYIMGSTTYKLILVNSNNTINFIKKYFVEIWFKFNKIF